MPDSAATLIKSLIVLLEMMFAIFPQEIYGKLQYGNGLKAFAIHLIVSQMVALNRVQKMIAAMIVTKLSETTLLSYVLKLHLALEKWQHNTTEHLLKLPCLYVDETSMKVERKNHWIHVYAAGDFTVKMGSLHTLNEA